MSSMTPTLPLGVPSALSRRPTVIEHQTEVPSPRRPRASTVALDR